MTTSFTQSDTCDLILKNNKKDDFLQFTQEQLFKIWVNPDPDRIGLKVPLGFLQVQILLVVFKSSIQLELLAMLLVVWLNFRTAEPL